MLFLFYPRGRVRINDYLLLKWEISFFVRRVTDCVLDNRKLGISRGFGFGECGFVRKHNYDNRRDLLKYKDSCLW